MRSQLPHEYLSHPYGQNLGVKKNTRHEIGFETPKMPMSWISAPWHPNMRISKHCYQSQLLCQTWAPKDFPPRWCSCCTFNCSVCSVDSWLWSTSVMRNGKKNASVLCFLKVWRSRTRCVGPIHAVNRDLELRCEYRRELEKKGGWEMEDS